MRRGRPKTNTIDDFFKKSEDGSRYYYCQCPRKNGIVLGTDGDGTSATASSASTSILPTAVEHLYCNKKINGAYGMSNLINHVKRKHPINYKEYCLLSSSPSTSLNTSTTIATTNNVKRKHPIKNEEYCSLSSSPSTSLNTSTTIATTNNVKRKHPIKYEEYCSSSSSSPSTSLGTNTTVATTNNKKKKLCDKENTSCNKKLEQTKLFFDENDDDRILQLRVLTSIDYLKNACITAVTEDGKPFSYIEDSSFKKLLLPYQTALKQTGKEFIVNRQLIAQWVQDEALKIRNIISKKSKNKMVHIKVDGVSKRGRSFLGINVQFMATNEINCDIEMFTLGTVEVHVQHTAENIKNNILNVIQKYGININQLYSFVFDNGASVLLTGKLLNVIAKSEYKILKKEFEFDDKSNDADVDCNASTSSEDEWNLNNFLVIEEQISVDEENFNEVEEVMNTPFSCEEEVVNDFLHQEEINRKLETIFDDRDHISNIRCAAHTLQLAVIDLWPSTKEKLDKSEVVGDKSEADKFPWFILIEKVRNVVKILKSINGTKHLKKLSELFAILDDTRWGSTFNMLECFLHLELIVKDIAKDHYFYHLSVSEWNEVEQIKMALEPAKKATLLLQDEKCSLRDLCRIFSQCIRDTKKIDHQLAKQLTENLISRRKMLFTSVPFLCALFLDPVYKLLLDNNQKSLAIKHLTQVYERLNNLKNGEADSKVLNTLVERSTSIDTCNTENKDDEDDDFLSLIKQRSVPKKVEKMIANPTNVKLLKFKEDLKKYDSDENIPDESELAVLIKQPTFNYWKMNKYNFKELFEIAAIIHSVPSSQVSAERLFSSLDFILSKKQMCLSDESVDDILLIRCNKKNMKQVENTPNFQFI